MDLIQSNIFYLALILAMGFVGGFLAGMLGVGGGIVFVPFLQEMVKAHPAGPDKVPYILANSLAIVFAVGISGTIKQYKLKNTDIRASFITGISAVASSLTISFLLKYYDINDPQLFRYIFSGILIITAARMLYGHVKKRTEEGTVQLPALTTFIPAGLFAGVVTSLTGLGGGVVMVPYFNKIMKLPIKFATGLSLSVIPIIALPLLVFYAINQPTVKLREFQSGFIVWEVVLPIIVVAMLAAPLGIRFAQKISSKALLGIFMAFILITLAKTLFF